MKKVNEVFFSIQNADTEKRLVSGISDSGEPNGSGLLLDYETSKPHLIAWSENISKKTNGRSKGVLRVMHQLENVGHIVSLEFDDDARKILVTVYVSDDKTWGKVQGGEYTGFSWWWRTQGMPWKNDEASEVYGKPIHSYTGKPIELSIVDAACVPGSDFTLIQNADFPEEEEMAEEITDPPQEAVVQDPPAESVVPADRAPEAAPEAPATDLSPVETDVKNGMYTAGRFGEALENLHWLIKATEAEEKMEGEAASIPDELKAGLRALADPVAKYMVAQVKELAGGEDIDMALPQDIQNGDFSGHPFRGNQFGAGRAAGGHNVMSLKAHEATRHAEKTGSAYSHEYAKAHHVSAQKLHEAAGNKGTAAYHKDMAAKHEYALSEHSKKVSQSIASLERGIKESANSLKASGKWMTKEGDEVHFKEVGRLRGIHEKEMNEAHDVHIKNADTKEAHVAGDEQEVKNAESLDLAALAARVEALESLSIKNAEASPAPSAPPAPILRTVTQEMDAGIEVKNADADQTPDPVRAEAERIASLPESERAAAIVKHQLSRIKT